MDAVASADEARRTLLPQSPHVLISDVRMPEENGYLPKSGFTTPAIALTARARRPDADAAQAAGFQLHVPKASGVYNDYVTDESDDFAAMFEASHTARRIGQGQTIEGTIVGIGSEVAFVDVGGKGEATIDVDELKDPDGRIEVAVGERIQAVVISTAGGLTLSRKLARGAASARQLEDAFRSGLPVEGKVEKQVKGGFEVRVAGQRAFCPFSQIDIARGTDPSSHEGKVYTFRITEFKEHGRSIVLSRRALLEDEQRAKADEVRRSIVPGATLSGRVASVRDFGAFVDLGGNVQGLLHVSEMAWSRTARPADLLQPGQEVTVKVLQVDAAKGRISLSLKRLTDEPIAAAATTRPTDAALEEDAAEYREFAGDETLGEAFGSLADKLRGALKPRDK